MVFPTDFQCQLCQATTKSSKSTPQMICRVLNGTGTAEAPLAWLCPAVPQITWILGDFFMGVSWNLSHKISKITILMGFSEDLTKINCVFSDFNGLASDYLTVCELDNNPLDR